MNTVFLKKLYKKMIPQLPGYHFLCLSLRKFRLKHWEWVNRIPVKPGILVEVHSKAGDFYMSHPERCSIAKKFFWTKGIREPAEDRLALDLFTILAKSSDVILDIGANSGLFSLVAAKSNPNAEIIAFDILPEASRILIDNLILNNLWEKVDVKLTGVGSKGRIFYAPFNSISSEMPTALSLNYKVTGKYQVLVPVKTLDEICIPRFMGKKLCIKIDVEGTEVDIFEHGRDTLAAIKPDMICEVIPSAKAIKNYNKILDDCSYEKYLIADDGLRKFDQIKPDTRYKDWFLTPNKNFGYEINKILK